MTIIFYIFDLLAKKHSIFHYLKIVFLSCIISLSIQAKRSIANEYALASDYEKIFLGDISETFPNLTERTPLAIVLESYSLIANQKALMMINRPQFPIGYLYNNRNLLIITFRPINFNQLAKNERFLQFKHLSDYRTQQAPITVTYNLDKGFNKIVIPIGIKGNVTTSRVFTERQSWFMKERNRLLWKHNITNENRNMLSVTLDSNI
jgi:hypothetical protein